jgi:hypothetical protein
MRLVPALQTVILLACGFTLQAAEPARKLLPVDEAAKDPSFFIFRARLQEALAKHDMAFVLSVVTPDIQIGFGGDDGIEAFKKAWKPEAKDSGMWSELARVLALGGKFTEDGQFQAPYVSAAWPEDLDPIEHVAIVGENVRVREKPDANSAVMASLSYDLVTLVESSGQAGKGPWSKIKLADGREGYVSDAFLGSGASLRAYFEKKNGAWKMTALVAGD